MAKRPIDPPDLKRYDDSGEYDKNRLLSDWLDDEHRSTLYEQIARRGGKLEFFSRDTWRREPVPSRPNAVPTPFDGRHKKATLITDRRAIEAILSDKGERFSSRVYAELGGGGFMLALDPCASLTHRIQREAYRECFEESEAIVRSISHSACEAASLMSFKSAEFDLASFAEQAALRFCEKYMGYAFTDHLLLETNLRATYRGLVHQVVGRHFSTNPLLGAAAKEALARLMTRTSDLLTAYLVNDQDALVGCEPPNAYRRNAPVLQNLARYGDDRMTGEQRAMLAVGAIAGTVGNVQAAACIAVKALLADKRRLQQVQELARADDRNAPTRNYDKFERLIAPALRDNPPIPLLPRIELMADGGARDILLALGGATRNGNCDDDPLVWGNPPNAHHHCAGANLAWSLLVEIVRFVMGLPSLAEALDPKDARPIGLKKTWGFICESYPLTHRRDLRISQTSLNVAMRLKSPIRESADRVREVIRSGAPEIEKLLRESRHVHFAWFELIESDSVLVLHTVYDGPFEPYVQHFALKAGDLFDSLFKWIENPPPMPVKDFPNEFVAHIRRYDRSPAVGYFYSAYPKKDAAVILRYPDVLS